MVEEREAGINKALQDMEDAVPDFARQMAEAGFREQGKLTVDYKYDQMPGLSVAKGGLADAKASGSFPEKCLDLDDMVMPKSVQRDVEEFERRLSAEQAEYVASCEDAAPEQGVQIWVSGARHSGHSEACTC